MGHSQDFRGASRAARAILHFVLILALLVPGSGLAGSRDSSSPGREADWTPPPTPGRPTGRKAQTAPDGSQLLFLLASGAGPWQQLLNHWSR